MTPRARAIINEIAALRGIATRLIVNPCRIPKVYRTRIEIAKRLHQCGYSTTRIGSFLNHDHTTILYYLGNGKRKPSPQRWLAPKIRTLFVIVPPKPPRKKRKIYLQPYAGADMTEYCWKRRETPNFEERP